MSYRLSVKTCRGQTMTVNLEGTGEDPYVAFATYGDLLLTGADFLPSDGSVTEGSHALQVSLIFEGEKPILVASCYLLCPCDIDVDNTQRAQSKLITTGGF